MSLTDILKELSPAQQKHLDPKSPAPMRTMAAKGLAPASPRDMVLLLCGFYYDSDSKFSSLATQAMMRLPEGILLPALSAELPPAALYALASLLDGRDSVLERVVVNRKTPDDALVEIAPTCSAGIVELLAEDQERCLRSKKLVDAIRRNPNLGNAQRERLFDFLVRAGGRTLFQEMPEFRDACMRLGQEVPSSPAGSGESPDLKGNTLGTLLESEEFSPSDSFAENEQGERTSVLKLVSTLTPGQKVALATKGNKEARKILIRDRNKAVAAAALQNPRITEQEIVAAAQSKAISEEVVRLIAENPEYIAVYSIKLALVNNPKTPLGVAMRLLPYLRQPDIKNVSTSRGIPSALVNQAKRLLKQRR